MGRSRRSPHLEPVAELAVIHNELARAHFDGDMDIVALRLVIMLAERVGYNDQDFMRHRFKVAEYAQRLGLRGKGGSAYAQLETVCRQLLKTLVMTQRSFNERVVFQMMKLAKYFDGEGEIELHFHDEMKPLLLQLREYFARIPVDVFFRIRSIYSARMYMQCKSWDPHDKRNKDPGWSWTVEELRQWLALEPNEYVYTPHLKSAILDRVKKELDEVADVSFEYTTRKEGKAIAGFDFVSVPNKPKQKRKAHALPASASAESTASKPDYEPMARLWTEASPEQRDAWLQDDFLRRFAPKDGEPPRRAFLARLYTLTEARPGQRGATPPSSEALPSCRGTSATVYRAKFGSAPGSGFVTEGGRPLESTASAVSSQSAGSPT